MKPVWGFKPKGARRMWPDSHMRIWIRRGDSAGRDQGPKRADPKLESTDRLNER